MALLISSYGSILTQVNIKLVSLLSDPTKSEPHKQDKLEPFGVPQVVWKLIWKVKIPLKILIFILENTAC